MIEGDDHHPQRNVDKQSRGHALTNEDRASWIDEMARAINAVSTSEPVILACSALNKFVRDRLSKRSTRACVWIWLDVPKDVARERMATRNGHFMNPSLLQSQFDALDPPDDAVQIPGDGTVQEICAAIRTHLQSLEV